MKYSIETLRLAFDKTWITMSQDETFRRFFDNDIHFVKHFNLSDIIDEFGELQKYNNAGSHLNTVFYHIYQRIAENLHPDPSKRYPSLEECKAIFTSLENRPTQKDDLMKSVITQEVKYTEQMKSLSRNEQMYAYLYYNLYKGMVEQILDIKREIKNVLVYTQLKKSSLTICQSCIVLVLLKVPIISFKESVLACGFKGTSVSDFRVYHNKFRLNEDKIANHGRETPRNLEKVIDFLGAYGYEVTRANNFYKQFKDGISS